MTVARIATTALYILIGVSAVLGAVIVFGRAVRRARVVPPDPPGRSGAAAPARPGGRR